MWVTRKVDIKFVFLRGQRFWSEWGFIVDSYLLLKDGDKHQIGVCDGQRGCFWGRSRIMRQFQVCPKSVVYVRSVKTTFSPRVIDHKNMTNRFQIRIITKSKVGSLNRVPAFSFIWHFQRKMGIAFPEQIEFCVRSTGFVNVSLRPGQVL